ncbi:MAG TPA: hypothetical protein VFO85_19285, partial [Vicinamibacteria bacterium]|nr:hypothetical protein [Vicinamibacteria bacterium]
TAQALLRAQGLPPAEATAAARFQVWHERALSESLGRFFEVPASLRGQMEEHLAWVGATLGPLPPAAPSTGEAARVYRRQPQPRGPLTAFGYDYFLDKYGEDKAQGLALLQHTGARGSGDEYAYEALNLVDGRRSVQQIRDMLAAIYGPLPVEAVAAYLRALAAIGVLAAAD